MLNAMKSLLLLLVALILPNGCTGPRTTTPVIDAARAGNTVELERLLSAGADANQRAGVNDWTPLMHAIHKGQTESVRVLLRHRADVHALTAHRSNALIMAAGYGYAPIVRLLLDAGADPAYRDDNGQSALSAAVGGTTDIDRFTVGKCQTETVRVLLERAPQLRAKANVGDIPKRIARFAGCSEVVALLETGR